jgi:hypothetical protein
MDSAFIQTLVAGIMVLAATLFLGRRAWQTVVRSRRASIDGASCGADGGCGCVTTSAATPEGERQSASSRT